MKKIILKNIEMDSISRISPVETTIEADEASDGYHTFDELYEHRIILFIALCRCMDWIIANAKTPDTNLHPWRSRNHHAGGQPMYEGWFIMGIGKEEGSQISYHVPIKHWEETNFVETLQNAPEWDGHTPADVLERLKNL